MRGLALFALMLMQMPLSFSQDKTENAAFFGIKSHYGYIIPHSQAIRHLTKSNPYGIEIDFGWILSQQEDWERCNCYSRAGLSASQISFDNPDDLGTATNIMMFAEPYLNHGRDVWMSVRMGVGPSYISKVYDENTNPENLFFSNHMSFIIHLDFMLNFRLSDHMNGKVFGKYNHISNGGVDQPNKGMNFPTLGFGIDYALETTEFQKRKPVPIKQKGIIPSVAVFGAMKNVVEAPGDIKNRTFGYGLIFKARKKIAKINALNAGLEGYWDGEIKEKWNKEREYRQLSLLTGHDLIFGRFIFSQYWGTYLYAPYYKKSFFQRYSLTYNPFGKFRIGINLKAHAEVAQNFSVHLAYDLTQDIHK